jgi:hypothetical protein
MPEKHANGSLNASLFKALFNRLVKLVFWQFPHYYDQGCACGNSLCCNFSKEHILYPGLKEFPQRSKECELAANNKSQNLLHANLVLQKFLLQPLERQTDRATETSVVQNKD